MNAGLPAALDILLFGGHSFRQSFKYLVLDLWHISVCFLGSFKSARVQRLRLAPPTWGKESSQKQLLFSEAEPDVLKGLAASFLLFGFLVHSALERHYCE